ncbi:MAG: iron ABC transporter permease, partial [Spirochaetales bacterium]
RGIFCARRNFFGKNFLLSLSAIPLCMPPLLIALGFVLVFGMQGSVNRFIMQLFRTNEPSLRFLYSFWGIVIAQGFYNFPIVMKSCYDAWKTIPPEQAHAAKLLGASNRRVFFTVTLYQLTPALVSSCILVCLYCFFSFLIVLLFGAIGSTTLEVAIYQAVRSSFDFKQAAILALIETSIALCLVFAWSKSEKAEKKNVGITYGRADNMPTPLQKNERPLFFIFMSIVFLFFLLPIFSVAAQAFSGNNFYTLFSRNNFWQAFFNTVQTAFLTATLSVIAALVVAVFIRTYDPNKKNIGSRVLPLLPMSVSSVVMGFGMTVLVSRGTPLALVFAQAALTWPLAFKQISATMDRIPQENLEAAQLLSSDSLEGIFRVQIPLCRHSIASAFGFCFAVSSADAVLPLVLAIPRYETLALFTYRLAGSYRFGEACAAGTVLLALSSILFYGRKKI